MKQQQCYTSMATLLLVVAVVSMLPPEVNSEFSALSQSLTIPSKSNRHRRFGYLDGFGKSKIMEMDTDDISSLLSTVRPTNLTKHKLAGALTLALFASLLSQPLWHDRRGYWTTVTVVSLAYLIEAVSSSTRRYLSNMLTPFEVIKILHDLRDSRPIITWDVECYHYRYTHAHHSGKGRRAHESRTKVVTHRASQSFFFNHCIDKTDVQELIEALEYDPSSQNPFLKITFGKLVLFRDLQCYNDYLNQYHSFLVREGNRDTHTDTKTTVSGKLQVGNDVIRAATWLTHALM
ncbi:hypothetical protein MHU86_9683 [Fragilaria crotonensis]|nr:hypothetical protein MHU86_9683 [Fragilaria crotonensis]